MKIKSLFSKINIGNFLGNTFFVLFCSLILVFSLRGMPGNPTPTELNTSKWRNTGPFEQTGRYALLYSFVEDHSLQFSLPLARFATPDLATFNNQYVSLFAPGVSFIAIPGYLIGKLFGAAQVGTFAVISLFALCNILLIRAIGIRLGINPIASAIGGITFAFATPAFPYAVDLYQHHISTFIILLSIYSLMRFRAVTALIIVWFLSAASVVVDYPNFLMMMPIGIFALTKLFIIERSMGTFTAKFKVLRLFTFIFMLFPFLFFFWFNQQSYGNPLRLSGALPRVTFITPDGKPGNIKLSAAALTNLSSDNQIQNQFGIVGSFNPRLMINGLYVHFLSVDRGMLVYTPVIFLGMIGGIIALKRKLKFAQLLMFVAGVNILIYSMWGDPWGGWAFGSRYLIPSYAILSIFVAYLLSLFGKNNLIMLLFFCLFSYSVIVNSLGALTSSLNPPSVEAIAFERETHKEFKYTYARNIDFLNTQGSKSFVYQNFAINYISAWDYYIDISLFIIMVNAFLLYYTRVMKGNKNI